MYPEMAPFAQGMLDVGEGNTLYWEVSGNPNGKPAVFLHGGPGSGCNSGMRRYFNPDVYCILLFDQRGCGRSLPSASEFATDLSVNTTEHLLGDMERLRHHLGIERWMVCGGSWGVTLGLAYAERFPERVSEMVLLGITNTSKAEIDWLYHGVAPLFPEEWARFRAGAPDSFADDNLVEAYYQLLQHPDQAVRVKAAQDWCDWESCLLSIYPGYKPSRRWSDPTFQMTFARLVTHYFRHYGWIEEGSLLRNAHRLTNIPGILIHGRFDLDAPLVTAWKLAQVWPNSTLQIIHGAGHSATDPGLSEAVLAAIDSFASRR